jgi:hypothetical protein
MSRTIPSFRITLAMEERKEMKVGKFLVDRQLIG